jgi:hypothetical protein
VATSEPFEFAKYKRPQFEGPLKRARAAESEDDHMPTENLSDLLDQVSKNSTGGIDGLIGDLERLRGKLQTDGERIQREIEEYRRLSQLVMQLTKGISENVEKVRASADRPQGEPQEWRSAFPLERTQAGAILPRSDWAAPLPRSWDER